MNNRLPQILLERRTALGKTQEEVAAAIGKGLRTYQYYEDGTHTPKPAVLIKLAEYLGFDPKDIYEGAEILHDTQEKFKRHPKTQANPEREGVIFVPIAAQANYAKSYTNPVYLNQLERIYIPGFPYRGDAYRIFEVAGDSMEPTFKEGYHVVTEYIEPAFWNQLADFYTYVVVTENQVMLKRIFKKSDTEFVLISDNEEFHPQIMLPVEKIKELWFVKRKLDWEMSPPKRFEIKI